ncbi:MAG: RNA polymerase sigma factor [Alistipes sp.]|nr:RNA polymerase sigma factor [Alistipes sp.]
MEQEQKLIRAILRRGSKTAADTLIRQYYDEIYAYVYRQVGNREDALDLTQECFIAVLGSLHTYDPKKAGFRTWAYHIASHKIIDFRRRGKTVCVPLEEWEGASEKDFTADIRNKELLKRIEQFVCGMPPQAQEVFRMRLYGEYRFPEIAAVTGEPEAKIKAQYYRLLEKIRKEFGEYDGF